MKTNRFLHSSFVVALILFSASASAAGFLDEILATYQAATTGWMKVAQGYATTIFSSLLPITLAFWSIDSLIFEGLDVSGLIGKFAKKILWMGFFFTVIYLAPTWVPQVTATFMVMGKGFAGSSGTVVTSPSQILDIGVGIGDAMFDVWKTIASGNITSIGNNFVLGIGLVGAALAALAGFSIIALQLLLTQIELAIIAPIGVVVLGFFAAPATKAIAEKYPSYLISVGVKLMVIFAMASLGPQIGEVALAKIAILASQGDVKLLSIWGVSATILIYGILCLQIPAMASGMLSGSVSTSLGAAAGAAMAAGGAVAGAAMAAGGAAMATAKAGMGAAGAAGGAMDAMSRLLAGGGDVSGSGGDFGGGFMEKAKGFGAEFGLTTPSSGASSSSPFGEDPFKNYAPPASGAPDSIGGTPSAPSQPKAQSTFSSGMDKLNQGIGGLAASEGQTGSGVDINSGNHGS